MSKDKSKQDIDHIFENIVGGGGRWQWFLVVGCTFPIHLASCLPLLIHLFAAYEAKHRCYIPGCDAIDKYRKCTLLSERSSETCSTGLLRILK